MDTVTIVFLVLNLLLLGLLLVVSVMAAYLLATGRNQRKAIVFLARNEKRLRKDLELWQDKFLQRAGAGALRPPAELKPPESAAKKAAAVRHVSPSEAIENTKVERANIVQSQQQPPPSPQVAVKTVPNAVKTGFLKEAAEIQIF